MRHLISVSAGLLAAVLAGSASATVNHGDFLGTNVDFRDVSETTTSAGDAEPLWGAPSLGGTGDQLLFFPPNFVSSCAAGASDVTDSVLVTTLEAHSGNHIGTVALQEGGDATLTQFPPFGTAATNASAALTGTVTVLETTSGPIAPVVIPFSGTFLPTGTFALPTNFGVNTWTGSISVDVASQVALATKVEVSLTNSLAANCAPGNSSASIQKKVVSGPAVAILVNPLACELQLNKTCCVTQPVLPDLDNACEGDLERLVLEFTGDDCKSCNNDQGKKLRCEGRRKVEGPADLYVLNGDGDVTVTPDTGVQRGDLVEITSATGLLPDFLKLKVHGTWWRKQYLKIDTSCERAIACGDRFGAFRVKELESTLGGYVNCDEPPTETVCAASGDPEGTPCDAKVVDMVLEYVGQPCQDPLPNPQNGEAQCSGDATGATNVGITYAAKFPDTVQISPSSGINDGDRIRVTSTKRGGLFPNPKFIITDSGGVRQTVQFHTSCSQPLFLGDEFGSFKLVEFTTKTGTQVALGTGTGGPAEACEVPLAPPGPHCTGYLDDLTLVYIGDFLGAGCTVSNPQGGNALCSGVADPGDPVSVSVTSPLEAEPPDQIEFGDLVEIHRAGGSALPNYTHVTVTGAGGSQTVQIGTGCQEPLSLGDRFGSFVIYGMDRREEGSISLGGNVQYQYAVTNPNDQTVDNVAVSDDQLGAIVSGVSLAPGETQTFTRDATLFGTTTNVAVASGDVNGDICDVGSDSLTVNVLAPAPGSFTCSKPISAVTLIWNGSQTVDLNVWNGGVGTSMLTQFDDVAPGDAVEVTGITAEVVAFEIFNSSRTAKLGESAFDQTCKDPSMNGVEDCGKNNGNLRYGYPSLVNDWLLEGMVDSDETLSCTPGLVPNPPACGFGPELVLVLPGLLWWHRRRLQRQA